jgi:hypothetical protein
MWIGVPKDASVCLRCRLRISRSLLPLPSYPLRRCTRNSRTQSTAAAVVEDPGEDVEEPRNENRSSKKAKKRLRRSWKPPRVAELGVSSLGKPAEVLVLKDRDRHVPAVVKDEAGRSKASQPRILEALQAENLPLSSESVKQSLDQIGNSYRNQSRVLSTKDRTELRKKLMGGFTQNQLRSYCMEGDRPSLVATAPTRANDGVQKNIASTSLKAEEIGKDELAAKVGLKPGKAGLTDYIMHHKWALASLGEEQISQHVSVASQKLEYMLSCKPSSLEEYAKEFNVEVDASKEGGSITIRGKLKHVRAAQSAIVHFLKGVGVSRVRSVMKGEKLERLATVPFLNHVTRTYNVMIDWASKHERDMPRQEDWLTICFHKTRDLQNALNAERSILLHERRLLPAIEERLHLQKVSMWLPASRVEPDLILHQPPQGSKVSDRQKAWARWSIPQEPTWMGSSDQQPDTSPSELNKTINKQIDSLRKFLKGVNDEFFHLMPMKKQSGIRRLIDAGQVKEEIFVHVGKILFPDRDITITGAFNYRDKPLKTQLLTAKEKFPTLLSADLPGIPNVLRPLSPWNETCDAVHGTENKRHKRNYRLSYVPLSSELSPRVAAPTIEIDVLRNGKPGFAVTNHVTAAWAILDKRFHKILSPLLSSDLEFVRRLKRSLLQNSEKKADPPNETTWLKSFEKQIRKLDSDQFPPFLQVNMPKYTARYVYNELRSTKHGLDYQGVGTKDASGSIASKSPYIKNIEASPAMRFVPKNITYMLECWELVNSTSYKIRHLCAEHLNLEGTTADENRELLRLAPQRLLDSNIRQTIIPKLLECAFKLAAQISHPLLLAHPEELSLSAIKTQHEEMGMLGKDTQQVGETETRKGKANDKKTDDEKVDDSESNSPEVFPNEAVPPTAVLSELVPPKAAPAKAVPQKALPPKTTQADHQKAARKKAAHRSHYAVSP